MLINFLILLLSFNLHAQPYDNTRLASDFFHKSNVVLDDMVYMSCGKDNADHVGANPGIEKKSCSDSNYWFYNTYNAIDDLLDCYIKIVKKNRIEECKLQACDERIFSGVPFAFYFNPKPLDVENDGYNCNSELFKLQLSGLYAASCVTENDAYMVLLQTFRDQNCVDKELYLYYNENSILTCNDQKQSHLFYQKILCSYNGKTYTIYIYANAYASMHCVFSIKLLKYFNDLFDHSSTDKTSVQPVENATEDDLKDSLTDSEVKINEKTNENPMVLVECSEYDECSENDGYDESDFIDKSARKLGTEISGANSRVLFGILTKKAYKISIRLTEIAYEKRKKPCYVVFVSLYLMFWMMTGFDYMHRIAAFMLLGIISCEFSIDLNKKISICSMVENDKEENIPSTVFSTCDEHIDADSEVSAARCGVDSVATSSVDDEMKKEANVSSEILVESKSVSNLKQKIYESLKKPVFVALFTLYSAFCMIIKCEKSTRLIIPIALISMVSYAKYQSRLTEYSIKFRFAFIPILICLFFFDLTMFNICIYTYKHICDYCSEDLLKWIVENKHFDASQITNHTRKKTHSLLFIIFFITIKNTVSEPKAGIVNYFPSFISQPLMAYKVLQEPYNQASAHASSTFLMAFNYRTHLSIIKNDDSVMTRLELFGVIIIIIFSALVMYISLISANAHINILCDFVLRLLINSKIANTTLKKTLFSINNEFDINNSINQLLRKTSNYIDHKCNKENGLLSKIILNYTDCKKGASDSMNQISVLKSISNYTSNKYDANDIKYNLRKFIYYFKFITQFCFIFNCLYQKYKDNDLFQQSSDRNFLIQTIIGIPNAITLGVFSEVSMDFLSFTSK